MNYLGEKKNVEENADRWKDWNSRTGKTWWIRIDLKKDPVNDLKPRKLK